jgi:hypothetical protein
MARILKPLSPRTRLARSVLHLAGRRYHYAAHRAWVATKRRTGWAPRWHAIACNAIAQAAAYGSNPARPVLLLHRVSLWHQALAGSAIYGG